MELYYVQWAFRTEDSKHYSSSLGPAGTTLVPGERVFNYKFFASLSDATTLFEGIKEDPPCQDSINLKLHRVTVPENKDRLIQFLNNLAEFYFTEPPMFRGFKFDDEDHEELDEHFGFDFHRNTSW